MRKYQVENRVGSRDMLDGYEPWTNANPSCDYLGDYIVFPNSVYRDPMSESEEREIALNFYIDYLQATSPNHRLVRDLESDMVLLYDKHSDNPDPVLCYFGFTVELVVDTKNPDNPLIGETIRQHLS